MEQNTIWKLQSYWHSPTRLLSSPVQYEFPGDRFIPNRSLMDLDQAHSLLSSKAKESSPSRFNDEYRRKVEENLTLDSEGRPFRMLVFRGSPKSSRKSVRLIDEMRRSDEENLNYRINKQQFRHFPKKETWILDAPNLKDDYYLNIMDWGKTNIIAVALGTDIFLWNAENRHIHKLPQVNCENDYPTSVAWSEDAKMVAVGHMCSKVQLWDAETSKLVRSLEGHQKRVGSIAWNDHLLTSGSLDKAIINHDVRVGNSPTTYVQLHTQEVCGLKWSTRGNTLASGGNDNLIYIWEASKMSSSRFLHRFNDHRGAVKALAWCPYDTEVLASGGGTRDGRIKIWNIRKGLCVNSIDTKAQICGLEWNMHHKEILSGHGYSADEHKNQLCLWRYPSMSKVGELMRHSSRVLQLSQSPDGVTVVSAGADETLRFWEVFGPPQPDNSRVSELESLLSLKTSPIR
ncbi:cell division cycle 20.2, cofactor of APC complex-like [Cornus florida]|uniref:cell division cycle 20.2, cofactor of APC complex-like n=1 Tax=Cornus florida TaxID=4283 RepID=UPI00289C5A0C|nr:cell division cycle 20.2, cofactor of APC complex-like [Cornus florida]